MVLRATQCQDGPLVERRWVHFRLRQALRNSRRSLGQRLEKEADGSQSAPGKAREGPGYQSRDELDEFHDFGLSVRTLTATLVKNQGTFPESSQVTVHQRQKNPARCNASVYGNRAIDGASEYKIEWGCT
jgi:hypothetical protein